MRARRIKKNRVRNYLVKLNNNNNNNRNKTKQNEKNKNLIVSNEEHH